MKGAVNENVMCDSPAGRADDVKRSISILYAMYVRYSPGIRRPSPVYAQGTQAHPKPER
jgi:hypothetical protein